MDQKGPDIVRNILGLLRAIGKSDELFYTLADMLKKFHDALMKAGFTEEQATQIVAGFAARGGK